jgi:hypothetical protein
LPFTTQIDLNADSYRNNKEEERDQSSTEAATNINIDYIKLQTIVQISRKKIETSSLMSDIRGVDKDIDRTSYLIALSDADEKLASNDPAKPLQEEKTNKIRNALRNILITFGAFNQHINNKLSNDATDQQYNLGYTQGYFTYFYQNHKSVIFYQFN